MRVRILSGHLSGQVLDLPQAEAEVNLATGFAERAPDEVPVVDVPAIARPYPPAVDDAPSAPRARPRKG
jgi:hypothetical protein